MKFKRKLILILILIGLSCFAIYEGFLEDFLLQKKLQKELKQENLKVTERGDKFNFTDEYKVDLINDYHIYTIYYFENNKWKRIGGSGSMPQITDIYEDSKIIIYFDKSRLGLKKIKY